MQKAGKLVSGYDALVEASNKRKVKLIVLSEDSAPRTKLRIQRLCEAKSIQYIVYGLSAQYGSAIGKKPRAVLGLLDSQFAKGLLKKFDALKLLGGDDFA